MGGKQYQLQDIDDSFKNVGFCVFVVEQWLVIDYSGTPSDSRMIKSRTCPSRILPPTAKFLDPQKTHDQNHNYRKLFPFFSAATISVRFGCYESLGTLLFLLFSLLTRTFSAHEKARVLCGVFRKGKNFSRILTLTAQDVVVVVVVTVVVVFVAVVGIGTQKKTAN